MTKMKLKSMAKDRVKQIVNLISQKRFAELADITLIDESWCGENGTQADGMREFGQWLTEQLALWAEDEGKEFVVDEYDKSRLDHLDIEDEGIWADYSPTSFGEPLDFWFEIPMRVEDGKLISEFNVNI